MTRFADTIRRNRRPIALFGLIILLPGAIFSVLLLRAIRSDRIRRAYETGQRQQRVVRLVETDLSNWLFSSGPGSAQANARLRFRVLGNRVDFPDLPWSVSAAETGELRPFDPTPPKGPLTRQLVIEQYLPRIQAFRRDAASGRTTGTQYFRQLGGLVVQSPVSADGYVVDIADVLSHVNARLAELSLGEPFSGTAWMGSERTALPPPGAVGLDAFPFFAIVFEQSRATPAFALDRDAMPYGLSLLLLITVVGSVFVYRAIANEARLAELRNDFVAAVSHEFRSPLSSLLALAERLERVNDPEKMREYQRIISQDARRLDALVSRLLDVALMEEGKKVYRLERVDLAGAARSAIDACQHVPSARRIRFSQAGPDPLWVNADCTAVEHAIQNVIENAAKYSPQDSPIDVQCAATNGCCQIEIRDHGIGIPRDEQTKIFDKFYRGRGVSGLGTQGVGIGLALVRHVVESHGGSVTVDSAPGTGSRFRLAFPRADS